MEYETEAAGSDGENDASKASEGAVELAHAVVLRETKELDREVPIPEKGFFRHRTYLTLQVGHESRDGSMACNR